MDYISRGFLIVVFIGFYSFLKAENFVYSAVDTVQLNEVIVTGSKSKVNLNTVPMSVSVVTEEKIKQRFEPSVLPLLSEEIPGLFITQRGVMGYGVAAGAAGGMSIRGIGGSPTAGVLILIDGHPQFMGIMGHSLADSYQSLMTERIEVVRGPASMLYGSNAMGGVINIITKKAKENSFRNFARLMYGSFNTLNAEYSGSVRENKMYVNWDLGYMRSDGHRENMDFSQFNGYGKFGYDFASNWTGFLDFNLSKSLSSNPGSIEIPMNDNDADILRGMSSLNIENEYEKTSGALKLYYNFGTHDINDGYRNNAVPPVHRFHSDDVMFGVAAYQSYRFLKGNITTFGFDYQRFGGIAENRFPDKKVQLTDLFYYDLAGYMNVQQAFFDNKFTANVGIRLDHHQTKGSEWIPQLGLSYIPTQTSVFKAIASKGFRNPTIREMYMFPPQNPDLLAESVMNYEVSYSQFLFENKLNFGVNIFHLVGENMIQTLPVNGKPLNVNTGKVENNGLELQVQYHPSRNWHFSSNYSFLNMKYKLVGAPGHKLHVGGGYSGDRWSLTSGVQFIGNLYTSVGQNLQKNNFILWNARSSFKVSESLKLFLKGENLLNQKYEINAGYPMPGTTIFGGFDVSI